MLWHELSWPQLDQVDRQTPVIIPIAACEQHGRHLPLFVDTIQVTAIAERVEQLLPRKLLLLPSLWLGSSHHHKDFPGTITLTPSLYSEVIKDIARSVLRAGFRRLMFLNGHGGNVTPGSQALSELVAEDDVADDAYLALSSWWLVGQDAIAPEKHGLETHYVSHACEYETSLLLHLRPDLVDLEAIRPNPPVLDSPWFSFEYSGKVGVWRRFHRVTPTGAMGTPAAATSAKGESLLNSVVDAVSAFIQEFAEWPLLPKIAPNRN